MRCTTLRLHCAMAFGDLVGKKRGYGAMTALHGRTRLSYGFARSPYMVHTLCRVMGAASPYLSADL